MNIEENKKIMAENIKRLMEKKGVTNQQLCDDLGFKYTTFIDWKKGVTYPRIGKVEAMANYFGCEKSDLIEAKKEKPAIMIDELKCLTDAQIKLRDFVNNEVPEEKAELALRVLRSIVDISLLS